MHFVRFVNKVIVDCISIKTRGFTNTEGSLNVFSLLRSNLFSQQLLSYDTVDFRHSKSQLTKT